MSLSTNFGKGLPQLTTTIGSSFALDGSASDLSFAVGLKTDSLATDFTEPLFAQINKIIKPFDPIRKVLTTNILGLDTVGIEYNFLDIAEKTSEGKSLATFVENLDKVLSGISKVSDAAEKLSKNPSIALASFTLGEKDILKQESIPNSTLKDFLGATINFPNGGLKINFLEDSSQTVNLLLGQNENVDILQFNIPGFSSQIEFSTPKIFIPTPVGIPVSGQINFGGEFSGTGLTFGFDTTGIKQNNALQGFYIKGNQPLFSAKPNIEGQLAADAFIAALGAKIGIEGNDLLIGNAGNDELIGGAGIDTISYLRDPNRVTVNLSLNQANDGFGNIDTIKLIENIIGSAYADRLIGDSNANTILGGDGNDIIEGKEGSDRLFGENGNDEIFGGVGDDTLVGGTGSGWPSDILDGGTGNDTASYITATSGVAASLAEGTGWQGDATGDKFISIENLEGSSYNDFLIGDHSNNILTGLVGNDTLEGRAGDDTLDGGVGEDILWGGDGNDILRGGSGKDTLVGDLGNDILEGGSEDDSLDAGLGDDTLTDLEGNNTFYAGEGNNLVAAGSGDDVIYAGSGRDIINAGDGLNKIFAGEGFNQITSGSGNDVIYAGSSRDIINAGNGNNQVYASEGLNDMLHRLWR